MHTISFSDYKSDMDELGERASKIIAQQRRKIQDLERSIVALVASAGEMQVYDHWLADVDRYQLVAERCNADEKTIYRAKRI